MDYKEDKVQTLEMIAILQKIEIEIYKAKETSKLWGTPEGNPIAEIHLTKAEKFINSYKWPLEFVENTEELLEWLRKYRKTIHEYDITYGSMYKTRLENAFLNLENLIYNRLLEKDKD